MKLTDAQLVALTRMSTAVAINFTTERGQEAACQLDALGLARVTTDAGNSLGLVVGSITPVGRALLERDPKSNEVGE